MADQQTTCRRCRFTTSYACGLCLVEISGQCIPCHRAREHGGRYVPLAIECPHCNQLTQAPTNTQIRAFVLSEVFGLSNSQIAERLRLWSADSVRSMKQKVPRLCSHCQERIIPTPEKLKVLLFRAGTLNPRLHERTLPTNRKSGMTLEETASWFDLTKYQVRTICDECEKVYGLTVYRLLIQGTQRNCTGDGKDNA